MHQIQTTAKVIANQKVNDAYYLLTLSAPALAKMVKPGQFIHIRVNEGFEPFFRRPFSVYRAKKGQVQIFFEAVGRGSKLLARKKKNDTLDVLGPLGQPFTMPGKGVQQIVFVAGGIGVAPFMVFSDILKKHKARKMLLYGGRARAHTFSMAEFKKNGVEAFVATDDGSVGVKGRVSELFKNIEVAPFTLIYACGPKPMIAAVASFAKERGLKGEASMEEVMACGLGACLGCSILTTQGYKTVCHDGPVFALDEVIF
ncbi:MAG: dihydroorotate dehydrogenase electron transfer subunit [Candidatus Omnitrophica bacterium]|nr:dihydroorotate dehydrogenase electron transfer subunit [Candidatus Omnitrophota bacterium]